MNRKVRKPSRPPSASKPEAAYDQFEASSLFCPRCRQAVPVRKRLLLILPEGDKYEYLCAYCSSSVGTKMEYEEKEDIKLLIPSS
jgi:hypothetical protein